MVKSIKRGIGYMKKGFFKLFKSSLTNGIVFQLAVFAVKLLCGILLAQLITNAMGMEREATLYLSSAVLFIIAVALIPLYLLSKRTNCSKLNDSQCFREWLYKALLERQLDMHNRGEVEVKFRRDTEAIVNFYEQVIPNAVGGCIILAGSTILLCQIDYRISLFFFVLNLIQLLPILIYEKWAKKIHNETCAAEEQTSDWILEGYSGAHILKSYQAQAWYLQRYHALAKEVMHWGYRAEGAGTIENIVFMAIDSLLNYGSYVIIGLFVLYCGMDVSELPMVMILSGYLFSSISAVFMLWIQWAEYQAAAEHLGLKVLETENGVDNATHKGIAIACQNICKAFDGKQILSNVSLYIQEGEHILLLGQNGSGKSTLLRILLGLESIDSGTVTYPVNIENISYALQEDAQSELTLNEIVGQLIKNPQIDETALIHHLSKFSMRDAMNYKLNQLSAGQQKRFFLSVALSKQSQVLILDEPTNHLDYDSVNHLISTLSTYSGTMVICSHMELQGLHWNRTIQMEGGTIRVQ